MPTPFSKKENKLFKVKQLPLFTKFKLNRHHLVIGIIVWVIASLIFIGGYLWYQLQQSQQQLEVNQQQAARAEELQASLSAELTTLKNEDQYLVNEELKQRMAETEAVVQSTSEYYEQLLKLKNKTDDTQDLDQLYTDALVYLSKLNYSSASATLAELEQGIEKTEQELADVAAQMEIPAGVPESLTPPNSGYSRQKITTETGSYLVSLIAADLSSTRVIVDTAADNDCHQDCPVLSLADYVSRNGAYAGVNGSYFCPAAYPSCADKKNSFDLLVMNHKGIYFNSDNNVYSNNPAVIFDDSYIRFVGAVSQWGRDTSPNGVLSNYPLLVSGGEVSFRGDGDPKKGSRGNRSFVANQDNRVYIGVVHSATVAESALVMKALGMENALNLDNGGSTALWSGSYKVGPGRNIPNAILFIRR